MVPNGSRRGPPNEKPKIASTRNEVSPRAALKSESVMNGIERFSS